MLNNIFNTNQIKDDLDSIQQWGRDWTFKGKSNAKAIVFPDSEEQIYELIRYCNLSNQRLVPSGGRTGLTQAATAINEEIVLSFDRFDKVLDFDHSSQTLICQPGLITKDLQNFALNKNLFYPVDFASSSSSQIGGNIATNAGGIRVLKYGSTRNWISGLKIISGSGARLDCNLGLKKNNAGYDFRHLIIGSEGTLGAITEVEIELTSMPGTLKVCLAAVNHFDDISSIFSQLHTKINLHAFEFFCTNSMKQVQKEQIKTMSIDSTYKYYVLIEYLESEEDLFFQQIDSLISKSIILDPLISSSNRQYKELWSYRENISESLSILHPKKYDVSIKRSAQSEFIEFLENQLLSNKLFSDIEAYIFGHIGDDNLHINLASVTHPDEDFNAIEEIVLNKVIALHGSISAEHGIGLSKKQSLKKMLSSDRINLMRGIKHQFDPNLILNPGKVF